MLGKPYANILQEFKKSRAGSGDSKSVSGGGSSDDSLAETGGGLVSGGVLAFLAMRILSSQIYGVSTYDPVTFITVPFILALTAGAASFFPALRISRIQPADTLRAE